MKPLNLSCILLLFLAFFAYSQLPALNIQSYNAKSKAQSCKSIKVTWNRGDGALCLVSCRLAALPKMDPEDGFGYSASKIHGLGASLGNENFVVYVGNDSFVEVTGLAENSTYIFQVFELNYDPYDYLTTESPSVLDSTFSLKAMIKTHVFDSCQSRNSIGFNAIAVADYQIESILWNFSDTQVMGNNIIKHLPGAGWQHITMELRPSMGCLDEKIKSQIYIVPGLVKGSLSTDAFYCTNTTFKVSSILEFGFAPGTSYRRNWFMNDSFRSSASEFTQNFTIPTMQKLMLELLSYKDLFFTGCRDTVYGELKIIQGPVFQFNSDTCMKQGDLLVLKSPILAVRYYWNKQIGNAKRLILEPGNYSLLVVDSLGCSYSDSILVLDCKSISVNAIRPSTLKIGSVNGGLNFQNTGLNQQSISIYSIIGQPITSLELAAGQIQMVALPIGQYCVKTWQMKAIWMQVNP